MRASGCCEGERRGPAIGATSGSISGSRPPALIPLPPPAPGARFYEAFDGRRWTCFRSGKVCAITYARIQGKQAMIQRFQNSSLLAESLEVQPRLFVSQGPDKGKPERFPGGAELPVELPPPVVEPPARRARNRRAR